MHSVWGHKVWGVLIQDHPHKQKHDTWYALCIAQTFLLPFPFTKSIAGLWPLLLKERGSELILSPSSYDGHSMKLLGAWSFWEPQPGSVWGRTVWNSGENLMCSVIFYSCCSGMPGCVAALSVCAPKVVSGLLGGGWVRGGCWMRTMGTTKVLPPDPKHNGVRRTRQRLGFLGRGAAALSWALLRVRVNCVGEGGGNCTGEQLDFF